MASDRKGSLVLATGSGKTRLGVLALLECLEEDPNAKALIVVPQVNLKDNEWPNEIQKWGAAHLSNRIRIDCVQTLYKIPESEVQTPIEEYDPCTAAAGPNCEPYTLVVVDEIHTTLSEEYRKVHDIPHVYKLGLTATVPQNVDYAKILEDVCPVLFTYSIDESVADGVNAPYEVINVSVPFTKDEQKKYFIYNNGFNEARRNIMMNKGLEFGDSFTLARRYKADRSHPLQPYCASFWAMMSLRKWQCYGAETKKAETMKLLMKYPDYK